ncbi:hypothetical protein AT272_27510 [Bacillus cereus]|nr:hypothetical protein AT272_27510 [Bacillus cereus]
MTLKCMSFLSVFDKSTEAYIGLSIYDFAHRFTAGCSRRIKKVEKNIKKFKKTLDMTTEKPMFRFLCFFLLNLLFLVPSKIVRNVSETLRNQEFRPHFGIMKM